MIPHKPLASFELISVPHSFHTPEESFKNLSQVNTDLHLIHTIRGHGFMRLGPRRYRTDPGCVMCVPPHMQCLYEKSPGQPWEMINLHVLIAPGPQIRATLPTQFTPANLPRIHRLLRAMHRHANAPDPLGPAQALSDALSLLTSYLKNHGTLAPHAPPADTLVTRVQETIDAGAAKPIDVDALSADVGLSRSQLTRRFKAQTGLSVKQYWSARRLAMAQSLLRDTDWPLAQIADRLNFVDVFYLSRWFTAHAGLSSTEYRKKSRTTRH